MQTLPPVEAGTPRYLHTGRPAVVSSGGCALNLVAALLVEYEKLSGIPMLCNTSANHLGKGFFPDVATAADWGAVDAVWADGVLHPRAVRRG